MPMKERSISQYGILCGVDPKKHSKMMMRFQVLAALAVVVCAAMPESLLERLLEEVAPWLEPMASSSPSAGQVTAKGARGRL